jgi:hypothetical protein
MDEVDNSKERYLLIDAEREAARSFDKTMTTLSAGALALSFGFVREMGDAVVCKWLLYLAWAAFVLSLLSVLCSFLLSQHAMRCQRDINEQRQSEMNCPQILTPWATVIIVLNWVSLSILILGVVLFAVFAANNLFRSGPS